MKMVLLSKENIGAKGLKYALADFVKDCVWKTWLSFVLTHKID